MYNKEYVLKSRNNLLRFFVNNCDMKFLKSTFQKMKFSPASWTNLIVRSFLIFIVAYLWVGFWVRNIVIVFFVAVLITMSVNYLLGFIFKKRRNKKSLTASERKKMGDAILSLKLSNEAEVYELLQVAFIKKMEGKAIVSASRGKILIEKNKCKENLENSFCEHESLCGEKIAVHPYFHKVPTKEDVIALLHEAEGVKIVICSDVINNEVRSFFGMLDVDIVFMDGEELYSDILRPTETFPEEGHKLKQIQKRKLSTWKNMIFTRRRSKGLVIIGCVVLLTSIIVRPSLYYIIFASILFIFALIGNFRVEESKKIFD